MFVDPEALFRIEQRRHAELIAQCDRERQVRALTQRPGGHARRRLWTLLRAGRSTWLVSSKDTLTNALTSGTAALPNVAEVNESQ